MKRRPRRALPAIVVALLLLAVCVAVVGVLVQHLTGTREFVSYADIVARLHAVAWADRRVAVGGVLAIAAGLALLLPALLPGRAVVLPLAGDDGFTAGVGRRGLRRALRDAARAVDGVHAARVRLRRKKVRVTIRTAYVHAAGLSERVGVAVGERITRIGPDPAPRVVVAARRGGGSAVPGDGRKSHGDNAVQHGGPSAAAGERRAVEILR
jgi:hypothetical protein